MKTECINICHRDKTHDTRNRQGSTMAVVDDSGAVVQRTGYYASGTPFMLPVDSSDGTVAPLDSVTDRLHIGNRWLGLSGLAMYDNTARIHDPVMPHMLTCDMYASKFPDFSPFSHCGGNPIMFIDPTGNLRNPVASTYKGYTPKHENNFGASRGNGRFHKGVDVNMENAGQDDLNCPIIATHDGTVSRIVRQEDGDGGGIRIAITSNNKRVTTRYMHCNSLPEGLELGSKVSEGDVIGFMGETGRSRGVHLHYEILVDGKQINPAIDSKTLVDAQKLITPDNNTYQGGALDEVIITGFAQSTIYKNLIKVDIPAPKPPEYIPN